MPHYRMVGEVPRKRHTQFRRPDGGLYSEELMGVEGFSGPSSLLYHQHPPTALVAAEPWPLHPDETVANHPLKPRHFRAHKLDRGATGPSGARFRSGEADGGTGVPSGVQFRSGEADGGTGVPSGVQFQSGEAERGGADLVQGRQLLLANADVRLSYAVADQASPLYRNAAGDECVYLESGRAVVETVFGTLEVGQGDYVVLPTSTTHRWVPQGGPVRALVIEASGHIGPPRRYLSATGQFVESAPYSERDLRAPSEPVPARGEGETAVFVRHRDGGTRYVFSHHPFDVVGWDGCLYPFAFNIADFEPRVGRVHLPPPVHQTFEAPGFVVCSFCPRPFDFDPAAVPVPYCHANVDSDEVLFYVGGDFMSRRGAGIEVGSLTLHPSGFVHGPQPGSVEASLGQPGTEEWAVMVDTFRPLRLGAAAVSVEDSGYAWTWADRGR